MLTSSPDDPGHRIPRLSAAQWGVCVPAGCSAAEVQAALEARAGPAAAAAGLRLRVQVRPDQCQLPADWAPPPGFLLASAVFLLLLAAVAWATARDVRRDGLMDAPPLSRAEQYLHAFSARRCWRELTATDRRPSDLPAVHGVRFLNAGLLLMAHKAMALFYHGFHDRTVMAEHVGEAWTVLARGASLYTDPFLLLSGLLTAHSLTRALDRDGRLHWRREYASRVLRLLPPLAATILFCTHVLPWLGSGPQWNLVVRHHATLCRQHWWKNMLFVHNYFGFENMCLTHTHHVGIDTQLFFAAPPLVWLLWRRPRLGAAAAAALAAASAALRYRVTQARQLTNFVHWGVSVSKLFESANHSYILPSHRATVYLLGLLLGYALVRLPRGLRIKEGAAAAGWAAAAALAYASFLHPAAMGAPQYRYRSGDAASYAALAPVGWCLAFAWALLMAHLGRAGWVGRFLSWPGFQVTTRLSYALYLTQFPVFFYNVGRARTDVTYSVLLLFNMLEFFSIVAASLALTLLVDLPAQRLRSLLLETRKEKPAPAAATAAARG